MNWDILMLFQFKSLKFIFFVKSSRIQGGERAIRQIRFAWPYLKLTKDLHAQFSYSYSIGCEYRDFPGSGQVGVGKSWK